jgi:hypothetical protein
MSMEAWRVALAGLNALQLVLLLALALERARAKRLDSEQRKSRKLRQKHARYR